MFVRTFNIPKYFKTPTLPKNILSHCNQYKDKHMKKVSLFTWWCLSQYIDLSNVIFNDNGKPLLSCNKFISLSHSLNMVAIAIDDKPIGVDIEACIPENIANVLATRLLNEKDYKSFSNAKSKSLWFTEYWTIHEAYIKMIGEKITFNSFRQEVKADIKISKLTGNDLNTYILCVIKK